MEEVLEKLSDAVISKAPAEEDKSNFEGLYKNWGKLGNQEERRREILEVQKRYLIRLYSRYFTVIFVKHYVYM